VDRVETVDQAALMTATDRILDGLALDSQSDSAFWLLLVSVGLIALLFGVKLILREGRRGHPRRHRLD